jgi:predicted nucleotidyltransferase
MMTDISSYLAGWRQRAVEEHQEIEERRQKAVQAAQKIARFLGETVGAAKVVGIGSAFDSERFGRRSDIDLVVFGLPKGQYFSTLGQIMFMADFEVDLIPYESATELLKQRVEAEGVQLWP